MYLVAIYIFLGFRIVAGLGGFILSFLSIPFTDYRTSRMRQAMPVVFILLGLAIIGLIGFVMPLLDRTILPSISEYRIAGLLIAITQILTILAKREPNTPLLQTLIDIRRNLAFGQLDLDDAKRQIEIALEGMTVSDVLQDEIARLLSYIEEINIHLEAAAREIQAFTATIAKDTPGLSENQHALLMAVTQSVGTHIERVDEILGELSVKFKGLQRRAVMIITLSPETKDTVSSLVSRIIAALKTIETRRNQLVEKTRALKDLSINAADSLKSST